MRKDGVYVLTVVWGVVIVFGAVVLAFMIPVRRVGPFDARAAQRQHRPDVRGALGHVRSEVSFSAYLVAGPLDAAQQTVENEAGSVEEIYRWPSGSPPATGGRYRGSQIYTRGPWWTRGAHDGRAGRAEQAGGRDRQRVPAERHGFRALHGRLAGGLRRGPETRLGFRRVSRRFDSPRSARAYLSYFEWCSWWEGRSR
jgi:hypothetical protein